jgi:hypothetical protein
MEVANTLAYYDTVTINAVISFTLQAHDSTKYTNYGGTIEI